MTGMCELPVGQISGRFGKSEYRGEVNDSDQDRASRTMMIPVWFTTAIVLMVASRVSQNDVKTR